MDESAKVHENYEMVTDPVTGEKKKSLLPTIFHDSMTQKVAEYRGFAFEMNEQDPWFMFFSRAAGLALLVMTLGNNAKGQYLGLSLAMLDLSLTLNAHTPATMSPGDVKMMQAGIVGGAVFLFALAFRS
jgi:hypothetical protein